MTMKHVGIAPTGLKMSNAEIRQVLPTISIFRAFNSTELCCFRRIVSSGRAVEEGAARLALVRFSIDHLYRALTPRQGESGLPELTQGD